MSNFFDVNVEGSIPRLLILDLLQFTASMSENQDPKPKIMMSNVAIGQLAISCSVMSAG